MMSRTKAEIKGDHQLEEPVGVEILKMTMSKMKERKLAVLVAGVLMLLVVVVGLVVVKIEEEEMMTCNHQVLKEAATVAAEVAEEEVIEVDLVVVGIVLL